MSTDYYIYAEVRVNDRWYNLNPVMKKHDGTYVLHPIFDACSWFYDIYMDLLDCRISTGIPDDMSRELRSVFHENLDDECEGWPEGVTWRKIYRQSVFCVRYADVVLPRIKKDKPHKFGGYVSKRMIAAFEADEIDEIYNWLTKQEYDQLPENKQIKYSYYEWDEDDSDYQTYRTIHERILALLYWFSYADAFPDRSEYWASSPTVNDIRLFVERA